MEQKSNNSCEICEEVFKSKATLEKHFIFVHNNTAEECCCNICQKKFATENKLTLHIKIAHQGGQKLYICEYCEKEFTHLKISCNIASFVVSAVLLHKES